MSHEQKIASLRTDFEARGFEMIEDPQMNEAANDGLTWHNVEFNNVSIIAFALWDDLIVSEGDVNWNVHNGHEVETMTAAAILSKHSANAVVFYIDCGDISQFINPWDQEMQGKPWTHFTSPDYLIPAVMHGDEMDLTQTAVESIRAKHTPDEDPYDV